MKKIFSLMTVLLIVLGTVCFMSCGDDDDETPDRVQPEHLWFAGPSKLVLTGKLDIDTGDIGAGHGVTGNGSGGTHLQMTALDFMPDGTLLVYDLINGYKDDVYEATEGNWMTFEYNSEWSYFKGTVVDKNGRHESPRKYHYAMSGKNGKTVITDNKGNAWEYGTLYPDIDAQKTFRKFKNSEGKILFVFWDPTSGPINSEEFE